MIKGLLQLSFPAGVVKVFTENPYPTGLTFRLKNAGKMEKMKLNEKLLVQWVHLLCSLRVGIESENQLGFSYLPISSVQNVGCMITEFLSFPLATLATHGMQKVEVI